MKHEARKKKIVSTSELSLSFGNSSSCTLCTRNHDQSNKSWPSW